MIKRLRWLEQKTPAEGGILTERHCRLLQKHRGRLADPEQHVEEPPPGYLLCQDTYFVGTIKGKGRIYMHSGGDAHSSFGFAKLYHPKVPMTDADALNERVSRSTKSTTSKSAPADVHRPRILRPKIAPSV